MTRPPVTLHALIAGPLVDDALATRAALGRLRLAAVDTEALHDLRVGVRRLRSLLAAGRRSYGKRRVRRLDRWFRDAGRATGALRDEEVLSETLSGLTLPPRVAPALARWLAGRAETVAQLRAEALSFLSGSRFEASLAEVCTLATEPPRRPRLAEAEVALRLDEAVRSVLVAAVGVRASDVEQLHALRIRFKRLRYLVEAIVGASASHGWTGAGACDPARLGDLARVAASFQKTLGLVHDADVARLAVRQAAGLDVVTRRSVDRALGRQRDALARDALARLRTELGILAMLAP